jgi:serine/threonine protein kinase
MEYIAGEDLYTIIKHRRRLPEIEAAYLLKGVALALIELHK